MTANTTTATFLFQSAVDNAFYNYGNVNNVVDFFPVNTIALGQTAITNTSVQTNTATASIVVLSPLTFVTLPNTPANGMLATITDANVATWGANVTIGGGVTNALIRWNGVHWTIVGA